MVVLIVLAYAISYDRKNFPWRVVLWGISLQLVFAFIILWTDAGRIAFQWAGDKITAFLGFTKYGTEFMFGNLVKPEYQNTFGFQFTFAILPTIIYFSAVMSILCAAGATIAGGNCRNVGGMKKWRRALQVATGRTHAGATRFMFLCSFRKVVP